MRYRVDHQHAPNERWIFGLYFHRSLRMAQAMAQAIPAYRVRVSEIQRGKVLKTHKVPPYNHGLLIRGLGKPHSIR